LFVTLVFEVCGVGTNLMEETH